MNLPIHKHAIENEISTELRKQISVATICEKYKVWLVHAVPDGYTVDTSLFSDPLNFEKALDNILSNPIPNLACSTVEDGDGYNRFQSRFCGVVILDGSIIYANKEDGMTWPEQSFTGIEDEQIPSIVLDIEESINQKGQINELHVDTRNGLAMPYIDLDLITDLFLWRDPNRNGAYDTIRRFKQYIAEHEIPSVGLIRGKLVEIDLDGLVSILENEPNERWDNDEIPTLSNKLIEYLYDLRKYSFNQAKAIANRIKIQPSKHLS